MTQPAPFLTLQVGGTAQGAMPDWVTIIEIQARAKAEADAAEEIKNRRYTMGTTPTPGLGYDDRLYVRLGCCKRTAYDLLEAKIIESAKLKARYVVTEEWVRDYYNKARAMKKVA